MKRKGKKRNRRPKQRKTPRKTQTTRQEQKTAQGGTTRGKTARGRGEGPPTQSRQAAPREHPRGTQHKEAPKGERQGQPGAPVVTHLLPKGANAERTSAPKSDISKETKYVRDGQDLASRGRLTCNLGIQRPSNPNSLSAQDMASKPDNFQRGVVGMCRPYTGIATCKTPALRRVAPLTWASNSRRRAVRISADTRARGPNTRK